jgi:hypothetical protein
MRSRLHTYTAYSIGCAIAWAAVLAVAHRKEGEVLPVFAGWVIGWTSATIARYVYPPPRTIGAGRHRIARRRERSQPSTQE